MSSNNVTDIENLETEVSATKENPLTESRIHELLNSALNSRDKKAEKRMTDLLSRSLEDFATKFQGSPKAETPVSTSTQAPEVLALQKKLEVLEAERKREREETVKQAKNLRDKDAYAQLSAELSNKVRPEAVDMVAKLLFHADKKIDVREDGVFYKLDEDTEVTLAEGVKQFLKSKEAQFFIPPPSPKTQTINKGQKAPARTMSVQSSASDPITKTLETLARIKANS